MKNKKGLSLVIIIFAVVTLCCSAMAFMVHRTEQKTNSFTKAVITCEVEKTVTDGKLTGITVENTGNTDVYIRVRLISNWVDKYDNILGVETEVPDFTVNSNWIADGVNDTYYYKAPVAAGISSVNLLGTQIVTTSDANGNKQVIEIFAETIQAKPSDAVEAAWSFVYVENGNLAKRL
ncbi:MAG: hypothetical protein E7484_03795 [Ruminococcaceae bacterium]|nr:hypothetical protein [Oscillospiraceae bacterium]